MEQYEKDSVSYEKQIQELLRQKKEADKKIKSARRDIRNHVGMKTFGDLVKLLGFRPKEKGCNTLKEFEELRRDMCNRIKELMEIERMLKADKGDKLERYNELLEIERKYKEEHPELYSDDTVEIK